MFSGPVRGGNRGGAAEFKWENVKEDKYRENYLGHSVNAPVGRWQKGKDLNWYNKERSKVDADAKSAQEEMLAIKEREAEALAEALGFTGKKKKMGDSNVSNQELKRLLQLDTEDFDADDSRHAKGLGFGRRTIMDVNVHGDLDATVEKQDKV
ncbi:hypothetical protein HDU96_008232 [Phlyctochytrium bullatum]|nr:hypothetical protein HDU96_008232 [Phlyctochytrium bullatum]